jgi:hypothetical protein
MRRRELITLLGGAAAAAWPCAARAQQPRPPARMGYLGLTSAPQLVWTTDAFRATADEVIE